MSTNIKQLIAELCPDGVEWKKLGEVTISLKKDTLKLTDLIPNGKYPVINSGREWYGRYNSYNNEGNALTIAARGEYAGYINYINEKFWAGGLCYPYRSKDENLILTKYIFYALKAHENIIMQTLVSRGSIPALNKTDIDNFPIPLPPLPVQEEIVRILDKFTADVNELIQLLERELELRHKQYEYYRNKLLTPTEENGSWLLNGHPVEWKTLGEIVDLTMGTSPKGNNILKNNIENAIEFHQGKNFFGNTFINQSNIYTTQPLKIAKPNSIIMSVRAPVGSVNLTNREIAIGRGLCSMVPKEGLLTKFLYYFITNNKKLFDEKSKGSTFDAINTNDIKQIRIPIPPLSEQERIVAILDKFDALVNDISQGLPAEIEARKKQYEYYRNKLLTFKEKDS